MKGNGARYSPAFKFKVVLEALRAQGQGVETEVARACGIHPVTLSNWKRQFLERGAEVFGGKEEWCGTAPRTGAAGSWWSSGHGPGFRSTTSGCGGFLARGIWLFPARWPARSRAGSGRSSGRAGGGKKAHLMAMVDLGSAWVPG